MSAESVYKPTLFVVIERGFWVVFYDFLSSYMAFCGILWKNIVFSRRHISKFIWSCLSHVTFHEAQSIVFYRGALLSCYQSNLVTSVTKRTKKVFKEVLKYLSKSYFSSGQIINRTIKIVKVHFYSKIRIFLAIKLKINQNRWYARYSFCSYSIDLISRKKQIGYTAGQILVCKTDEYLKKGQFLLLLRSKFENSFEISTFAYETDFIFLAFFTVI